MATQYVWFLLDQNGAENSLGLYTYLEDLLLITLWRFITSDTYGQSTYYVGVNSKENFLEVKKILTGEGRKKFGVMESGERVNGQLLEWPKEPLAGTVWDWVKGQFVRKTAKRP